MVNRKFDYIPASCRAPDLDAWKVRSFNAKKCAVLRFGWEMLSSGAPLGSASESVTQGQPSVADRTAAWAKLSAQEHTRRFQAEKALRQQWVVEVEAAIAAERSGAPPTRVSHVQFDPAAFHGELAPPSLLVRMLGWCLSPAGLDERGELGPSRERCGKQRNLFF